ncbi:unnamed protein product [Polarella glacialis]|uniref:B30.2/SPRY domain-containing protein n=1 Tax=Polarella glacialis TaxID=89957 RepID=A0A813FLV7_POLGL|nr:unnamed protein product [Polarella glacialis]
MARPSFSFSDAFSEAVVLHLLPFIAEPKELALLASTSCRLTALLRDSGGPSLGAAAWREAFEAKFCRTAEFCSIGYNSVLERLRLPPEFRWRSECRRRQQLRASHGQLVEELAEIRKSYLISKQGWVKSWVLEDGCMAYQYAVHQSPDAQAGFHGPLDDIAQSSDTVAVIHGRALGVMPGEAVHLSESDFPASHLKYQWRTRLPGARRLRYYELEVLGKGQHGFIACGAVDVGFAKRLRLAGAQPGWGAWRGAHSVGFHGDDGCVYPGRSDTNDGDFSGRPFGPRFSATGCSADALLDVGGPPPAGAVLGAAGHNRPRVCGVGMDLDRNCFFFTVDGALVGEVQVPRLEPVNCVPAVGLHSPGEAVRINLGLAPFWFPIEAYSIDIGAVPTWQNPKQWASSEAAS